MAKSKTTLASDVLARVHNSKPGFVSWFQKLPPDVQEQLNQAKDGFDPTRHQKKAFAVAIMEAAKDRGWEISGVQGVLAWLNEKR